jgi:uncharacterized lipoprotein YehR (DUF1307 family)
MASGSNSTTLYCTQGKGYGLSVSFSEGSPNIGNNTTPVTINGSFSCPTSHWTSNYNSYLRTYWHDNHDNVDRLISETAFTSTYTGQTISLSGTIDVTHNNDGGLSGYAFATFTQGSSSGGWCPSSGSVSTGWVELTKIARYSTISTADNFNDEGNPKITFTNPSGGYFSLRAKIEAGGNTQLIIRDLSKTATSCTFELTENERNLLRNLCTTSNSLGVKFTICCMNGNTELSASYLDRTMTIVNGNPIFNDFTYKDTNTDTVAVTGDNQVLVKGVSTLRATISSANKMVAQKGATAKNYVATIEDINVSVDYSTESLNIDLGTVNSSGTKRLNLRAYDSRNNSTLVYKDITIYDYEKPVIEASISRLNNWERETTLKVKGSYSQLTINNVDKNTIKNIQYRYRETNGTWSNWTNISVTKSNGQFTCTDTILSLDNTKSFEFEVRAIDNLQTTTETLTLDVGEAIFFISSNKKACYINGQEILTYDVVDTW